jgi:hypothetical protein
MAELRDRKVEVTELVPSDDRTVQHEETIRESSEDERVSEEVRIRRFPVNYCGHYKAYGFSCQFDGCSNRYCRDCQSRAAYCFECGITVGPCCTEKKNNRTYCPDHAPFFDWSGPLGHLLRAAALLGSLALALYLLHRLTG